MSLITIRVTIINESEKRREKFKGILNERILKYKESDGTTVIFDYNIKKLTRENSEIKMIYLFEKNKVTKGNIYIKDINKELKIDILTQKITINNNNIEIDYKIDDQKFKYRIEEII